MIGQRREFWKFLYLQFWRFHVKLGKIPLFGVPTVFNFFKFSKSIPSLYLLIPAFFVSAAHLEPFPCPPEPSKPLIVPLLGLSGQISTK